MSSVDTDKTINGASRFVRVFKDLFLLTKSRIEESDPIIFFFEYVNITKEIISRLSS
jgi:hypothetical protein